MKSKALRIAYWEFSEKVKSKAFIISLVLMPVIIIAMALSSALLTSAGDDHPIQIGVIDDSHKLIGPFAVRLDRDFRLKNGEPNYILRNLSEGIPEDSAQDEAKREIEKGKLEGYLLIPSTIFDSGKIEYRSKNVGNFTMQERFSRTIDRVIMEKKLVSQGLDTALIHKLTRRVEITAIKISKEGEERESGFGETFFSAYIGLLMIIFMVLTSGQLLVRSMVEEKSNRVIEVLLSSSTAKQLMAGKILGLSGLGILQLLVYALIGMAIALKTNMSIIQPEYFLFTLLFAILGYLFYASIFVAAGSPATTEQEAQQITAYVSMLMIVPFGVIWLVMQNPNSLIVRILSYIPLFTPSVMVLRCSVQMPSAGEILATVFLLIVSTVVMMWIAAKIFRIAILSYGKRPSLSEIVKWIKE